MERAETGVGGIEEWEDLINYGWRDVSRCRERCMGMECRLLRQSQTVAPA